MFKWIQGGLSAAIGTAEPEYGREAIQSVIDSIEKEKLPIYRETTVEDFAWRNPENTNVETQSFYFTCLKTGLVGFAQVIHSNVVGQTAQFTFRLYNYENGKPEHENIWTSTKLDNFKVDGPNFYASGVSIEISEDGQTYRIKSEVNPASIVDLTVTKLVPGVIFGKDGVSNYGEDPAEPWGNMRHLFWPRCSVTGSIKHNDAVIEIDGFTMFVMACQGMKPHHAAKAWNFLNFQNDQYSAVQMEFTTPPSYGNTKVNIGLVADNEKILLCSVNNEITHITPLTEEETPVTDSVGWPVPESIEFKYNGDLTTNKESNIVVSGKLNTLVERVDVMAELPQFIKDIATGVSGTKPYIYQFCNKLEIDVDGNKSDGIAFNEVTFISE